MLWKRITDQLITRLDRRNLGTLGGGNHFIEILQSDNGFVWLMIHSGSRNLGKGRDILDLSEAPQAYKDIEEVISSERDLVEVRVRLTPLAVVKG